MRPIHLWKDYTPASAGGTACGAPASFGTKNPRAVTCPDCRALLAERQGKAK